ncbi:MAG: hypothetical protein Q9215_004185 [Flavoplaca cf. flavocitrina]
MAIDHSNTAKPANFLSSEAIDDFRARLAQQGPDRPDVDFTQFLQKTPRCSPSLPFPSETEKIQAQEASAAGDLTTVKRVTHDWKGNMQGFSDSLMVAIDNGHMAVASYLLEYGSSVENWHFRCAIEKRAYPFLQLCLDHGYNINDTGDSSTPAVLRDQLDDEYLIRWLLDHGADPNSERICLGQRMGETPVSIALWRAPNSAIKLLIERGGPGTLRCGHLLWYAVGRPRPDRVEVMEYLLRNGADADVTSLEFEDRPEAARQAEWYLGRDIPLHVAARGGHLDAVKLLIAWGADPAQSDSKGRLPIDVAEKRLSLKSLKDYSRYYPAGGDHGEVIEYLKSLATRDDSPKAVPANRLERL